MRASRLRRGTRGGGVASCLAFLGFLAVSVAYFGSPLLAHPGRSYVGEGADPQIFIWSFAWWPHAILHGQNPFVTHAIWAPAGVDLAWTATAPGLALAFAPLTLLAGPVVSYNVAAILLPALAAWTSFLLCRYLTRSFWPSLVAGYLFGFSSYMLGQEEGHMHMTAVALVPLVALVVLRYLDAVLDRRGLVIRLGLLLAAQLYCSTELLFTLSIALAVALLAGFTVAPARRQRVRSLLAPLAGAYGVAALLGAPLLYFALADFHSGAVNSPDGFVTDLANLVVPTRLTELGGASAHAISRHFPGGEPEQGAYLGLPAILIAGWFLWTRRRAATGQFLAIVIGAGILASFGSALFVDGRRIIPLPWTLVDGLPLFDNVLTVRLMVFVSLAVAVAVALWANQRFDPWWLPVAPAALALLALVPQLSGDLWKHTPQQPAFFTTGAYRTCLRPGENVLILPFGPNDDAMLWQAKSGFRFKMVGGYISPAVPKSFDVHFYSTIRGLLHNDPLVGGAGELEQFVYAEGVSTILVDASNPGPWQQTLAPALASDEVGGVRVYAYTPGPASSAACAAA